MSDNESINKEKEAKKRLNTKYYEKYKERLAEKIICKECGNEYQRSCKTKHEQSKKHNDIIKIRKMEAELKELRDKINNN